MTATSPPNTEQLADLVGSCIDRKDIHHALATCQQLNHLYPGYAYGWYLASYLMRKGRNHADALRAIDRSLHLSYDDRYQQHKVKCLVEAGDVAGASAAVTIIRDKSFTDPLLHGDLGSQLYLLGDHARALVHYSRAIELDGGNPEFHYNKAAVQRFLGDAAGAGAFSPSSLKCRSGSWDFSTRGWGWFSKIGHPNNSLQRTPKQRVPGSNPFRSAAGSFINRTADGRR